MANNVIHRLGPIGTRSLCLLGCAGMLAACGRGPHTNGGRPCDYQGITRAQVHAHYPNYDVRKPIIGFVEERHMRMFFPRRPGFVGGSPEVNIDIKTCKVLRVYRTQ